jgi:hypothetical protein
MKGDRVEVVVDTGGAVQTFDIVASRAGRRSGPDGSWRAG